ncbi:hypothetical protein [Bacillus rubiinfantis]|uniref:hypothetical protein n=1 Tax=Bacillus rubiinfantis TaxID=1499680 RepID=UPI0005AB2D83|nr:hypothetical protein [Bacillus rubiinfantis]
MSGSKNTLTAKFRNLIPEILKKKEFREKGLRFTELYQELTYLLSDEIQGDRTGVLRGIVNKIEDIPVENVRLEKRGKELYFIYVPKDTEDIQKEEEIEEYHESGTLNELERLIQHFLDEVQEKRLTQINLLSLDRTKREIYLGFLQLVSQLDDIQQKFKNE